MYSALVFYTIQLAHVIINLTDVSNVLKGGGYAAIYVKYMCQNETQNQNKHLNIWMINNYVTGQYVKSMIPLIRK